MAHAQGGRLIIILWWLARAQALQVVPRVLETIQAGRVAVIDDYLSAVEVEVLRRDAVALYDAGLYSAPTRDRQLREAVKAERAVLRGSRWRDYSVGSGSAREAVAARVRALRLGLAAGLEGRGDLATDHARHEVSYTRFAPGAALARHIDEHHEEAKGRAGWREPTRRSVSWLVYLNQGWAPDQGGELRVYERRAPPAPPVGATRDGDLQVGWLRATRTDPVDRPVFLDARRANRAGNCALRAAVGGGDGDDDDDDDYAVLTRDFYSNPVLFLAADLPQRLLFLDPALARRYARLEELKTPFRPTPPMDLALYEPKDVAPRAGRLVLFDSVALPHEVLETTGAEPRFAVSGWFHQTQQPLHAPPGPA